MALLDAPASPSAADLLWLDAVLGTDEGPDVRFRARMVADEVRLLVPLDPPAAAAAGLHRPHDDRGRTQRVAAVAARAAARTGLLGRLPGHQLSLRPFALTRHLAQVLGYPAPGTPGGLTAAITLGPRRRNRKPVVQLIEPSGRVVGFAKVGWSPLTTALVDNEAAMLGRIANRLPAWLVAPEVLHHEPWRTGTVAVATPLGPSSNWSGPTPGIVATARAIAAADSRGPFEAVAVSAMPAVSEWRAAGAGDAIDLDAVIGRHAEVRLPVGLWHGDLTPWNMAATRGGLLLWDWEFAGLGRPVGFDLLHHRFEQYRRAPGGTSSTALAAVVGEAAEITGPLGLHLETAQVDAMVDLYLVELACREARLDGQRWSGPQADLGPEVRAALARRSGPRP